MRDLQHLEELSSAVALGFWADDVVLALDQAISGNELSGENVTLLREAADIVEAALEREQEPLSAVKSVRALAATDTTLSAAEALVRDQPGTDQRKLLGEIAEVLREAAGKHLAAGDTDRARPVMELFDLVGEHQLVEGNSVLSARREARSWTEAPATSSSS